MMIAIVALLSLCVFPAIAAEKPPAAVVCFGDSVTLGVHMKPGEPYPDQLQKLLDSRAGTGRYQIVNAGIGGNTTQDGLARLQRDVLAHKPRLVLINFGLNDSTKTAPDVFRVSPDQYRRNLQQIVERIRAAGGTPILSTITPIIEEYYFDRHPRAAYENEGGLEGLRGKYNAAIRIVAKREHCPLVDLAEVFANRGPELLRTEENSRSRDGVHPNAKGYALIAESFASAMEGQGKR